MEKILGQISTWYITGIIFVSWNFAMLSVFPSSVSECSECKNISFNVDLDSILFQELLISNVETLLGIFKCFISGFRLIVLIDGLILIL